jgi:hypothetical protein
MKVRGEITAEPTSPNVAGKIGTIWGIEPEVLAHANHYNWIIIYDADDAIGLVSLFPQHPLKDAGIIIEHMRWNPRASNRRIMEAAYTFGVTIPKEYGKAMIGYSKRNDFNFFKKMQKLGVLRKIGKQRTGFNEMVTAWETPQALLS